MRDYAYKPMEELAAELAGGLRRLRKGYGDAAEEVVRSLEVGRQYPYDFVVFRLTGYRPRGAAPPEHLLGRRLRDDLLRLMLDVCDSFELPTSAYAEPAYDAPSLARKLHVSTKTLQRWRRQGLPARRLVFPDRKRRIAFLASSVQWFTRSRPRQVQRSAHFTQMTDAERERIIARARRYAARTQCTLNDVARRLAARTGRAVETVRYTIRRHDVEHPDRAVFPPPPARLDDAGKDLIYRCFLRGVPVAALAKRYGRTRGSIYRIVNEARARQLVARPIPYVYSPEFDLPDADDILAAEPFEGAAAASARARSFGAPPPGLPAYLRALYEVPLMDRQTERATFRLYNYLKYKADRLRRRLDPRRVRSDQLKAVELLLLRANVVKNRIIRANLRLVVSIAKRHLHGPQGLFELISDGNVSLMQAVEKFDYSRGNRFSTYASWAIMRNFARSVPRERFLLDRFATGHEDIVDIAASLRSYEPDELNVAELRESLDTVLAQLAPRERAILVEHYGLDDDGRARTFEQLGHHLGLSKERVRQIEKRALKKLRHILRPKRAELMS